MSYVCGKCVAYRNSKFCGDCGCQTYSENQCSNPSCASVALNCKHCPHCGSPMFKTLLQGGGGHTGGSVRTTAISPRIPPSQQMHQQQKPQFFQETVRPSEVYKGVKGEEEGINKYRSDGAPKNDDLRTDDEESKFLAKYQVTRISPGQGFPQKQQQPQPTYKSQQQQNWSSHAPPSQSIRGNPHSHASGGGTWGAKYGNSNPTPQPYNVQPSFNISQESTIRPSVTKQSGDDLDKYRVKWEAQLRKVPASPDKPVQLLIDGNLVLNSFGKDGVVSSNIETQLSTDATFSLKVPAVGLDFIRDLKIEQGRYVRFSIEGGQLKFMQSKLDFD